MKVKDLYLVLVEGKVIIKERDNDKIVCEIDAGETSRKVLRTLEENNLLERTIDYIEIVDNKCVVTIA